MAEAEFYDDDPYRTRVQMIWTPIGGVSDQRGHQTQTGIPRRITSTGMLATQAAGRSTGNVPAARLTSRPAPEATSGTG